MDEGYDVLSVQPCWAGPASCGTGRRGEHLRPKSPTTRVRMRTSLRSRAYVCSSPEPTALNIVGVQRNVKSSIFPLSFLFEFFFNTRKFHIFGSLFRPSLKRASALLAYLRLRRNRRISSDGTSYFSLSFFSTVANFIYSGLKYNSMSPVGPLRCLRIRISAIFFRSVPGS